MLAGEERGDALAIEDAELDGAGGDRLEPGGIETAIGVQNPQGSPETLFGVGRLASTALIRPSVFGPIFWPNGGNRPASTRRNAGGSWACARKSSRACGPCTVADGRRRAGRDGKSRPCGRSRGRRLRPGRRVRDRIEEVVDVDVIVEVDARSALFRELPIVGGQGCESVALDFSNSARRLRPRLRMGRSFMRCMTSAMASLHSASEKKVSRPAGPECRSRRFRPPPRLSLCPSADTDAPEELHAVMGRHGPVGPVDLGVVERGLVDPALRAGREPAASARRRRSAACARGRRSSPAGSVPGRLGVGEVRSASAPTKTASRISPVVGSTMPIRLPSSRRTLVAGDMVLAHHRRQPALEPAQKSPKRL